MSEVVEQVQDEAEALASAMAGYGMKARDDESPAESTDQQEPEAEAPQVIEEPQPTEAEKVAAELAALKAQVTALRSNSDPDAVRKMYGEIGNINRTLQELKKPAEQEAPAEDELAVALREAEQVATDFEELGGPLVRAIKAMAARSPQQQAPGIDIDAAVAEKVQAIRNKQAIEALEEDHPDWDRTRQSEEFTTWLQSKPEDYRQKLMNTWNPMVVSRGLSEFKDSLKVREKKQNRLSAAVTPQGVPQAPRSSTIPDEEGALIGYAKGPKRLFAR